MRTASRAWAWCMVMALAASLVTGTSATASVGRARSKLSGTITVSAASSLTEAFTTIGAKFERRNKRATVSFNFGSSSTLVTQIQGGAPADVFASADLTNMDKLVSSGRIADSPTVFARNELQIAVKPGNPKNVRTLADLKSIGTISLCAASVPCGAYAANVLTRAGVSVPESSVTRGVDAKATIAAVAQGDANAALVYVTDVKAAGSRVQAVAIPAEQNIVADYPIAPVVGSVNAKLARAFVAYVASPAAQRTLTKYGFVGP